MSENNLRNLESNSKPKITAQIEMYDQSTINNQIKNFVQIRDAQKKRCEKLEAMGSEETVAQCQTFLDENGERIQKQVSILKDLQNDIQSLVNKADNFEKDNDELNNLVQSDKYNRLAKEIVDIRSTIEGLNGFLERKKVAQPPT